jgi:preprotein translocase subunit SecD
MRIVRLIAAAFLISASALIAVGVRAQDVSNTMSKPGAHLVLLLDVAEVRAYWLSSMRDEIRSRLRQAKIGFGGVAVSDNTVLVRLGKPEEADAAVKALANLAPFAPRGMLDKLLSLMGGVPGSDVAIAKGEGGNLTVTPSKAGLERRVSAALDDAVGIASRRLDGMKISAIVVRRSAIPR